MESKHCYELFGIECGKGWYPLLEPIFEYIEKYNVDKEEHEHIKITQIKEKWGLLNIYVNFGTDELYDLIDKAEDLSDNVCEDCGTMEDVGTITYGWIRTVCCNCAKKQSKKRNYPEIWRKHNNNTLYIIEPNGEMKETEETEKP